MYRIGDEADNQGNDEDKIFSDSALRTKSDSMNIVTNMSENKTGILLKTSAQTILKKSTFTCT